MRFKFDAKELLFMHNKGTESLIVAVVEDDIVMRGIFIKALETFGIKSWGADSAEDFFRKALVTQFEIVIVDLGLPGEDGLSLIHHLSNLKQVGIIAVTGDFSPELKMKVWASGVDNLLQKPFAANELAYAVQNLSKRVVKMQSKPAATLSTPWFLYTTDYLLETPSGYIINLSHGEMDFIKILARTPEEIVSNETIMGELFKYETDNSHRLNLLLNRFRKKFKSSGFASPIRSVFGRGRVFAAPLITIDGSNKNVRQNGRI